MDDRHNITMTTEVVEDVTFVTSVLKICELHNITDVATYTCVATVPRVTDSASFELDVRAIHAAIVTDPTNITVVIGTEVSLMCQAEGAPLPSFSWTLGGVAAEGEINETVVGDTTVNSTIDLGAVNVTGVYVCSVSNGLGDGATASALVTVQCEFSHTNTHTHTHIFSLTAFHCVLCKCI